MPAARQHPRSPTPSWRALRAIPFRDVSHEAETPVGDDGLTLNQVRPVAAQEHHDIGELPGRPESVAWCALLDRPAQNLVLGKPPKGLTVDHAARHRVDADTSRGELDCEIAD